MIPLIYIERAVADHPRVAAVLARHPRASRVYCERYGEIFNRRAQNFRLQKRRPALILARKHDKHVLRAPDGYGVGGDANFYFSHALNCLYDCRYCFLQGMYRSAHYVVFVNFEDFQRAIDGRRRPDRQTWFFSGYDGDSLAFEPVTGFADTMLPFFAARPDAWLELRTKSTQVRTLLQRDPVANCVTAFSFTPAPVARTAEHRVPAVAKRIDAMARLARAGWPVGLRFDPLIFVDGYREHYAGLFREIFSRLPADTIHSVSLGPFRLPRGFFNRMVRLYPEEPLFAGALAERAGLISYAPEVEAEMVDFCTRELLQYVDDDRLFPCLPDHVSA
jgi:spore photoproduct lyase